MVDSKTIAVLGAAALGTSFLFTQAFGQKGVNLRLAADRTQVATGDIVQILAELAEDGAPIQGGTVTVLVDGVPESSPFTTDADGIGSLPVLFSQAGIFEIQAEAIIQDDEEQMVKSNTIGLAVESVVTPQPQVTGLTFSADKTSVGVGEIVVFTGSMVFEDGSPAPDTRLSVFVNGIEQSDLAPVSDNQGQFVFTFGSSTFPAPGNYDVQVQEASGLLSEVIRITVTEEVVMTISLQANELEINQGDSVTFSGLVHIGEGPSAARPHDLTLYIFMNGSARSLTRTTQGTFTFTLDFPDAGSFEIWVSDQYDGS